MVIAEKYRVIRILGRGGMGEVFEVEAAGKPYALKSFFRIEGGTDAPQERARFLREAAATKSLVSDNLVRVHEHGFDPETGTPFIVMDLLVGEDLDSAIQRVGPLDPRAAVLLHLQAARGLDVAHHAGIVHRDIKPANLFLSCAASGEITTKVCDFGIAKVYEIGAESLTATGSVLGSPLYMAPEQLVNAKVVDPRSDVWSLGMSLYHALTGAAAFHHITTLAELVVAITRGAIPPVQDMAPWVPPDLARVLHGTLLVQTAARCPNMQELSVALSAAIPRATKLTVEMIAPLAPAARAEVAEKKSAPVTWQDAIPSRSATWEAAEEDPLLGCLLAERYRLLKVLGRGGMGAVYEAQTADGKSYALKVIRPDLGDAKGREAMRRFVREAKASQGIESPYVAKIVDAGADEERGVPYITMELLQGRDLGRVIKEQGPIEPSAVVLLFVQACEGLAAAHARGIVHRDIKPANIFLHETRDGTVVAKLCDFGVAKHVAQVDEGTELTRTGGILGSPMYMSPEQATNAKNVDHRSDLWSLGISLYEALTGQKAWEGTTMGELILAICTREVQPILELAPWIRPELADVVTKAIARKPADRFASAGDFAAALRPLVTERHVSIAAIKSASEERRKIAAAARSSGSGLSRSGTSSTVEGHSASIPKPKGVGKGVFFGAGAALVVALGAGFVATRRPEPAKTPAPLIAAAAPEAVVLPKTVSARVAVAPPDATVTVNGAAAPVVNGEAVVVGTPGDSVAVVVESPAGRVETRVVLTTDGKAVPAAVAIPALAASASKPSHPKAAPTTKPAVVAVPPPTPSATAPSLKKSW
jgi:serine/threonine-protein kinase